MPLCLCAKNLFLFLFFASFFTSLREPPLSHDLRRHILTRENPHHRRLRREGAHFGDEGARRGDRDPGSGSGMTGAHRGHIRPVTPDLIRGRQRPGGRAVRHRYGSCAPDTPPRRATARRHPGLDPGAAPSAIMRSRCSEVRMTWPVIRIISLSILRLVFSKHS